MTANRLAMMGIAALSLAACQVRDEADNAAGATDTATTTGVTRQEVTVEQPAVVPMPAATVIQSQPGPDGSQVDLLKVAVTGDILTVTMRCSSSDRVNSESFRIADISIIDDATSQRISVLRDNEGNALVSDFSKGSSPQYDALGADCEAKPGVIWAKFPAPPATSPTISINFPEVAPFDGVPVTR